MDHDAQRTVGPERRFPLSGSAPPSSELGSLLERCRRGEQPAWEALVKTMQPRVYAMSYRYLRDPEEARDLTQDVFVRVYDRLATWSGTSAAAWILRLTRNLAIDRLRRLKSRPPAEDVLVGGALELLDPAPDPATRHLGTARRRLVLEALRGLDAPLAEMIVLKEIRGWSLKELAERYGVPLGTVKSRSNRARVELAKAVLALDPSYGAER